MKIYQQGMRIDGAGEILFLGPGYEIILPLLNPFGIKMGPESKQIFDKPYFELRIPFGCIFSVDGKIVTVIVASHRELAAAKKWNETSEPSK